MSQNHQQMAVNHHHEMVILTVVLQNKKPKIYTPVVNSIDWVLIQQSQNGGGLDGSQVAIME